ncbi:hypothetical protein [Rhizobium sp. RAF56]|uniref:hypothetical protein n=1 Tax=Rhizobium sp. RAF56 TaxID=3233062 RepID=UPI003F964CDE
MPEMNYQKKLRKWKLSDAEHVGQLLSITCQMCNVTRYYFPADFLKFNEDISLDQIGAKIRCEQCGRRDFIFFYVKTPAGADYGKLPVRRLERVRTVQVPVWRDETL